jgi:hypothetical protein
MSSNDELLLKKIHLKAPWSGQAEENPAGITAGSKQKKPASKNQRAMAQGISL